MNSEEKGMSQGDPDELENARTGYAAAINIWYYYGEMLWQKYNTMLVANSIVIAAMALVPDLPDFWILYWILPVLGLGLYATWYFIAERSREYQLYFMLSAREIEERYLSSQVKSFANGAKYSEGQEVLFRFADREMPRKMSWGARLAKTKTLSYLVIFIFALIYGSILIVRVQELVAELCFS